MDYGSLRIIKMAAELSVLIAKIASIMFLSIGVGAIFNRNLYRKIIDDTFKNAGIIGLFGFLSLIFGFLIINYHNIWVKDWTVMITVIGWIGLFKGIFLLAFPNALKKTCDPIFRGKISKIMPFLVTILGLILGYFGFLA